MQSRLFEASEFNSIDGFKYEPDFLSGPEEERLIEVISSLPLEAAKYKQYTARRRIVSYGDSPSRLLPQGELDSRLLEIRERVASWLQVSPEALSHVLVTEYAPGTPLGWHRDQPEFDVIAGVSLGTAATLRLRPYRASSRSSEVPGQLELEPRSIYRIAGTSRWEWQHAIAPTKDLRWSLTFRTRMLNGKNF